MTKIEIQKDIDNNRNEIQRFLTSELPIDIIRFNIEILSSRNERLIKQLDEVIY
jgi:hypothetical protein